MPLPPPRAPHPLLTPLAQGKEWLRQALERAGAGAAAAAGGVKRPRDEPGPALPVGPRRSAAPGSAAPGAPRGTGSLDSGSDSDEDEAALDEEDEEDDEDDSDEDDEEASMLRAALLEEMSRRAGRSG